MIELVAIVAIVALVVQHHLHQRHTERLSETFSAERREMLVRIQTPDLAPSLTPVEPSEEPSFIPMDDDAAWDEYQEQRKAGEAV